MKLEYDTKLIEINIFQGNAALTDQPKEVVLKNGSSVIDVVTKDNGDVDILLMEAQEPYDESGDLTLKLHNSFLGDTVHYYTDGRISYAARSGNVLIFFEYPANPLLSQIPDEPMDEESKKAWDEMRGVDSDD